MKRFQFRLQPLLKLRKMQEDQKRRIVGMLLAEINEQQQQALEMAGAVEEQGRLLKKQRAEGSVDLEWFASYRSYVMHMQRAINERIEKVTQIQKQLVGARRELAEAAKQTRILDKLKEKRKTRYDRELAKSEIRDQDEISTNMFLRAARTA